MELRAECEPVGALVHDRFDHAIRAFRRVVYGVYRYSGPGGSLARTLGAGSMVFWVLAMLVGYLLISLAGS